MVWMNQDPGMHNNSHTHIHQSAIVTIISCSLQAGSTIKLKQSLQVVPECWELIDPNGFVFLCTGLVVPVSSLICCMELKSMVYARPIVDKLTSSSPDW